MRLILDASKPRIKLVAAEVAPAAPAREEPVAIVPRPLTALAVAPSAPVSAQVSAPVSPSLRLSSEALQSRPAASATPALETPSAVMAAPTPAPILALPKFAAAMANPKLVSMVEPAVPPRVLDEIGGVTEVIVDLTIRPDGSIASVVLAPSAPRQLHRFVIAALEQWRYEPLPAQRVYRIQLVFNADR